MARSRVQQVQHTSIRLLCWSCRVSLEGLYTNVKIMNYNTISTSVLYKSNFYCRL